MKPLVLHRQAADALQDGRVLDAAPLFREALKAASAFVDDPAAFAAVRERAALIPGWSGHADSLAREFVGKLVDWITEWHFELYYEALIALRLSVARFHWQVLQAADALPSLRAAAQIAVRRDMVCQRLQVNDDAIHQADPAVQARARRNADLILRVDSLNPSARRLAVTGYAQYAHAIVNPEPKRPGRRVQYGLARPRQRRELRLAVRILNRHLVAGRSGGLDQAVVGDGFATLGRCHLLLGDADKAVKMIRRARRLKPGDHELDKLLKAIRGMPRGR
jgi:hypothetical protein